MDNGQFKPCGTHAFGAILSYRPNPLDPVLYFDVAALAAAKNIFAQEVAAVRTGTNCFGLSHQVKQT